LGGPEKRGRGVVRGEIIVKIQRGGLSEGGGRIKRKMKEGKTLQESIHDRKP